MAQVNCIREMFFEKGMNYAEIARATGNDVKTVKKYIHMDNFNSEPLSTKSRGSKLDPFKEEIDQWLEADMQERKKTAPHGPSGIPPFAGAVRYQV